jgi:predicted RNA binding protein YcfA (HicA-like mRNA interferase family)
MCDATANRPIRFHNRRYIDLARWPVHGSWASHGVMKATSGRSNSDSIRPRRNGQCSKVIQGRGATSFRDLQRLLIALGFRLDRISGSHHIYLHPEVSRPINIQPAGNDAKPYQIRQLRDMIREFGLKLED